MATDTVTFTVIHRADGWHAGIRERDERVFASRDEAIRWCHAAAAKRSEDASPEEGTFAEARVEIIEREDE